MKHRLKFILPIIILIAGFLVMNLIIMSRSKVETRPPEPYAPLVRVAIVNLTDYQLKVNSQGVVSPRTESVLLSQVSGQVINTAAQFAPGGFFKQGDVLIKLDPRDYQFALSRTEAELAQAQLRLTREEEEGKLARLEWERLGNSDEPHPLTLREPQLAEARAVLNAAQANLEQARLNLERTEIRAPYDGRVRTKNVDVGQYVTPGTPLGKIYAVDYAEVRLPIPDEQTAYLNIDLNDDFSSKSHSPVEVILTAKLGGKLQQRRGEIIRVEGEIDPNSHMINLVCRIDDPYNRKGKENIEPLVANLFVTAEIQGIQVSDVAVIPREAIRNMNQVLLVDAENKIHIKNVEILKSDTEQVVILSGLNDGDRVCLSSLEFVVEGMAVRVNDDKPQAQVQTNGGK